MLGPERTFRPFSAPRTVPAEAAVSQRTTALVQACPQVADYTLDDVLQADRAARDYVIEAVS